MVRKAVHVTGFLVMMTMLVPSWARAEFYQYEDEQGAVHFTDDPAKVPKKFSKKKTVRDDDAENQGNSVMKVTIIGNQVIVPVTVSYRGKEVKANFLLDTGASTSTISPNLATLLSINPEDADVGYAQGVGDTVHVVGRVKLDFIMAGPSRKYDMVVAVIPTGRNDGLLGMNFLRDLRYHVDFSSHTIRWGD